MKTQILVTFLFINFFASAQSSSRGTLPTLFRTVPQLDGGVRVNVHKKMNASRVFTASFTAKASCKGNLADKAIDVVSIRRPLDRIGFRVKLKQYIDADCVHFNRGFYHGPFSDLVYSTGKYNWSLMDKRSSNDTRQVSGNLGYNIGYTLKIRRVVIEPSMGIAVSDASGTVNNMWGLSVSIR